MKIGKFIADISNSNYQDTLGVKMEVEHSHTQTEFSLQGKFFKIRSEKCTSTELGKYVMLVY